MGKVINVDFSPKTERLRRVTTGSRRQPQHEGVTDHDRRVVRCISLGFARKGDSFYFQGTRLHIIDERFTERGRELQLWGAGEKTWIEVPSFPEDGVA